MRKKFFFLSVLFLVLINLSCNVGSKTKIGKFEDPYENDDISTIRDKNQKYWYYVKSNSQEILDKLNPKKNKNIGLVSVLTKEDSLYLKNRDIFFKNSFDKPLKINEYKRIFFHHFFLKKETITYGTFFYKGSICKNVFLSRKTEDSYLLFIILFLVFPLSIYMINNNVKIEEKVYSFKDIKEGSNSNVLMILFFGVCILSTKSEYIFNYIKNILFQYISWIFDSKTLFSFIFLPLLFISIYWAFCLILYLLRFKTFPERIPTSIIIFSSLMYCLFVGIYTGELYFYNLYEIFFNLIIFIIIFLIMFLPKMCKHIFG